MKRGFASVLWGDFLKEKPDTCADLKERFGFEFNDKCTMATRRTKIQENIQQYITQGYKDESTVYVFGKDNYSYVKSLGLKSVLLQDNPYKYHPTKRIYLHKLFAYQYVMEDFDEVVLLDFDMVLRSELPVDFWSILNKKDVFQASLNQYRTPRINHREGKANKYIPTGAFVYMRDKSIPEKLIKCNMNAPNKWSCEPAFAFLTDEMTNGWKGFDIYWERFEPEFYTSKRTPFKNQEKYKKNNIFSHKGR